MKKPRKARINFFWVGVSAGMLAALAAIPVAPKILHLAQKIERHLPPMPKLSLNLKRSRSFVEDFSKPLTAVSGQRFGPQDLLTFELYRGGTFVIDGKSGVAWQQSGHYRDSAFIRSSRPLPKTYKISAIVGDIDYDLEKVQGLPDDPDYPEGPRDENGCYLLAITDEAPQGHHTNTWWHQHRKVVIDVDNNAWGHGMPHPIFMVYFDRNNKLVSFDGEMETWQGEWRKAVTYAPDAWYRVQIERTPAQYILAVTRENGELLQKAVVNLKDVWHADASSPDFVVVGDPHENYYQGSMKIKSIRLSF